MGGIDEPTATAREAAFADLLERDALHRAYRFATLMLGDRREAEDAAHDAALIAWQRFSELREQARIDAWFGRILVNVCRDRLRARRRALVVIATVDPVTARGSSGPDDPADGLARRQAMASALRALSAEHREVIVLRYYLDLTVDQVAARTGARAGTVKSRLHYALRELRAAFDSASRGPGQ